MTRTTLARVKVIGLPQRLVPIRFSCRASGSCSPLWQFSYGASARAESQARPIADRTRPGVLPIARAGATCKCTTCRARQHHHAFEKNAGSPSLGSQNADSFEFLTANKQRRFRYISSIWLPRRETLSGAPATMSRSRFRDRITHDRPLESLMGAIRNMNWTWSALLEDSQVRCE